MAKFFLEKLLSIVFIFAGSILTNFQPALAQSPPPMPTGANSTETLLLSGNDWKLGSFVMKEGEERKAFLPGFDDRGFRTVKVPGEVQLQLGLSGMELYRQSKTLSLVNSKEWWYRKQFRVGKEDAGRLNRLVFDGVDYFSTVWLNGKKLGEHEGAYVPFSYDVSGKLNYGGDNVLVVKVTCPWYPDDRGFLEYMKGDWVAVSTGSQSHSDKPPYFLGPFWDGIPNDGNATFPMGLTRDVKLVTSGFSVVSDLFVSTRSLNPDGGATLGISGTIQNYREQDTTAQLNLKIAPENFSGESIALPAETLTLHPGENHFALQTTVSNPHLWWSWDLGKPNLYKLTAALSSAAGGGGAGVVFGIRTVTVKKDMSYWLNGRRLFLKGAWYPMSDYYGAKTTHETFVKDLELVKAANLNHLVAFTVVEKPDFYNLCDRMGIMLVFELPFPQSGPVNVLSYSNPRREIYVKESLSQVRQVIVELRNHPSIMEWAAFAEAHEKGGGWGSGGWDFDQYGYGAFAAAIGNQVESLDPGTIYHPSLCDLGEQHFWQGNAGMNFMPGSYRDHFEARTGFVSEYGSLSLPTLESFKKELSPEDMWRINDRAGERTNKRSGERNDRLPRWYNLPINVGAYAYLSSFTYDGLASTLDRVNQYVDRDIRSAGDLVDDSELYQAFLMKYATEAYRRKKYDPINGIRFWDFGEVWPGIRWGIVDYYRVPKMSYYFLKNAEARFALSFAYKDALESQVSGSRLRIPVWVINDLPNAETTVVHCRIEDLSGHIVWSKDFAGVVPADGKKEMGVAEWVTPDAAGVYVLTGQALAPEGGAEDGLEARDRTFIKVTPKLFSRPLNVLLIGQSKDSLPIAQMIRALGVDVDVIDEDGLAELARLSNGEELRKKYDVVWLAAFDSFWRLLNQSEEEGLREAVHNGAGFIHTGGRGSFHGGFGEGAALDLTSVAGLLPVTLEDRYDLVLGQPDQQSERFTPIKDIQDIQTARGADIQAAQGAGRGAGPEWTDGGLKSVGLAGFNDTALKPGAREILSVEGRPLLVTGRYGQGRTVAFTGFTPTLGEGQTEWVVDEELYENPVSKAYFEIFAELLAAATGEKPRTGYRDVLAKREEPLFEVLKNLPPAEVKMPTTVEGGISGERGHFSIQLTNGGRYARLIRLRAKWDGEPPDAPYLVLYNDNYFDLAPGETKTVEAEITLFPENARLISGTLFVEGTNLRETGIAVKLRAREN